MEVSQFIIEDIKEIKEKIDILTDRISNISVEMAKNNTRMELLSNLIENSKTNLDRHERTCQARKDMEELRNQFVKFSIKLLISYIALAVAAVSAYGAVQKLF